MLLLRRQILGLIGSIILFIGVFTPIVSIPIVGSVNYFQNGTGDGVIILILSLISVFLIYTKQYKWLLVTGVSSLALLAFTFINFRSKISNIRSQMGQDLTDSPFRGLSEVMLDRVQIEWGWAVLIVGAGFLIASALLKQDAAQITEGMESVGKASSDSTSKTENTVVYATLGFVILALFSYITYTFIANKIDLSREPQGELAQAYKKLFRAVKNKDTEQIRAIMSTNSLGLAEFAAGQQKKPIEEVLKNGFTATTFSETLPEMRDERIKDEFGALEVWNSKDKIWEDLPFVKEDGVWKFAMGDMFKGSYQKPAPGMAIKEQEAANANNPNLIPMAPPNTNGANTNTNTNVNTVQVEPIKPSQKKKDLK